VAARHRNFKISLYLIVGALPIFIAPATAAERAAELVGTWDVVRVAVDGKDQMHWLYVPDDPRLLGRELEIGAQASTFNDGSGSCEKPVFATRKVQFGRLLATSFPRSPGPGRAASPTLADFGLPANLNKTVSVHEVRCEARADGRDAQPWSETWFVVSSSDRMFMRIGTTALLTLAKRMPNATPRPSFACSAATTPIELSLCKSVPLAALDRSVAAAFKWKLDRTDAAQLRAEQEEWLKRRGACGRDEPCLADVMRDRISELMQN
jgi:hypothetical protein